MGHSVDDRLLPGKRGIFESLLKEEVNELLTLTNMGLDGRKCLLDEFGQRRFDS